jgi:pimeloyl-ACP methyl ester carboxylesterase
MAARLSRIFCVLGLLTAPSLTAAGTSYAAVPAGQVLTDVVFGHYGTLSSNPELARRLLTPATAARIERQAVAAGKVFAGQAIDLAAEKFIVYVPSHPAARGYALLVFVPPWQQAGLPEGWAPILDHYGVIFVSAARSGNDENTMSRREPLALLAAQNVMLQYPVDSERVYIGGFSGGSRIAERLALGYPDLFHGAILNAGSDAIGDLTAQPPIPLPPRELFMQFQSSTRLVYITGERDAARVDDDLLSMRSMRDWCVFNIENIVEPLLGHTVAQPVALSRALGSLASGTSPDPARLSRCRATLEAQLDDKFRKLEALIAAGKRTAADKLMDRIDQQFGGLAEARRQEPAAK